jgi:hypothetical protein
MIARRAEKHGGRRRPLTEALEGEERTGVWFEEERVCGRPRAEIDRGQPFAPTIAAIRGSCQ